MPSVVQGGTVIAHIALDLRSVGSFRGTPVGVRCAQWAVPRPRKVRKVPHLSHTRARGRVHVHPPRSFAGTFSVRNARSCCGVRTTMKTRTLLAAVWIAAALFPAAAGAQQNETRGSCTSEAFRVCWRAMPDRHSVFLCLLDNRFTLNEPCRSTMMSEARLRMHHGVMDRSPHPRHEQD